jgi:hypothetical protein
MPICDQTLAVLVPSIATSRDGHSFDPKSLHWQLSRDVTVNLHWAPNVLSARLRESFVRVLTHYAISYSASHAANLCLLKTWVDLGVPGVDPDVPSLLDGWSLKGNIKGLAVRIKGEKRLAELIAILEDPSIEDGAIVRLRNEHEFSPLRRAVEAKASAGLLSQDQQPLLDGLRGLMGTSNG